MYTPNHRFVFNLAGALALSATTFSALAVPAAPDIRYVVSAVDTIGKSRFQNTVTTQHALYAFVTPSPASPVAGVTTTVFGTNAGFADPIPFVYRGPGTGLGGFPDQYAPLPFVGDVLTDPGKLGPWTITATATDATGSATSTRNSLPIDLTAAIAPVTDVSLTGNGLSPRIRWSTSFDERVDSSSLFLFREISGPTTTYELVYANFDLGPAAVQADIPLDFGSRGVLPSDPGLLPGGKYIGSIFLRNFTDDGQTLSQSTTYFEFRASNDDLGRIFLPTVTLDAGGSPIYNFDLEVLEGQTYFLDPDIAVGYDFAIGDGDPGFATVELPDVGDGRFDIVLFDSAGAAFDTGFDAIAGEVFSFVLPEFVLAMGQQGLVIDPDAGIAKFGVRGIEAAAALDPFDVTAFQTGVSFVADGRFTGTQTPVVQRTSVPEPAGALLLSVAMLLCVRRRRMRGLEDRR